MPCTSPSLSATLLGRRPSHSVLTRSLLLGTHPVSFGNPLEIMGTLFFWRIGDFVECLQQLQPRELRAKTCSVSWTRYPILCHMFLLYRGPVFFRHPGLVCIPTLCCCICFDWQWLITHYLSCFMLPILSLFPFVSLLPVFSGKGPTTHDNPTSPSG